MSSSRHFSGGRREGKAPEKSNFVQTCNLLSQYIKEKGSLRDLNLEIGGKVESLEAIVKPGSAFAAPASRTDSSLRTIEDASNKASTSKDEATMETKTAQLTIFYSGRVLVFDDYPADKAKELVSIAKKGSSQMSYGILSNTIQEKTNPGVAVAVASTSSAREGLPPRPQGGNGKQPIGISSNTCKDRINSTISGSVAMSSKAQEQLSSQSEANGSDLPIARRSSLHRFLEKRKDRAGGRGPYQNQEQPASSSKGDEQIDLNICPKRD